ncbi:MAG: sulfite exporter TauE/SafE family protein [Nanoarchaeota archaeon]
MELISLILVFLIGLSASFLGSIVGGGGLISIPLLILMGLPPHVAFATNRVGTLGMSAGMIVTFWRKKKILWRYVLPLTIIGMIAGLYGANLLIKVDEAILDKGLGIILLLLLPLFFIEKEIGLKHTEVSSRKKLIGYIAYALVMVWGGFFGAGTGVLLFYALTYFFGFTLIESNATSIVPWLFVSLGAVTIFAINGLIHVWFGIILVAGMYLGGMLGSLMAVKKGNRWVKMSFMVMIVALSIKLLFF